MKTLLQEHDEEQSQAKLVRLLREKDEAWFAYFAALESERRQRCFGIVALVSLAVAIALGIWMVINLNR